MRRFVAEYSSIVLLKKVKIDKGKVEANDIALGIFPDLLANQPISGNTANGYCFIGDLHRLACRLLRNCHTIAPLQMGHYFSCSGTSASTIIPKSNGANPDWDSRHSFSISMKGNYIHDFMR